MSDSTIFGHEELATADLVVDAVYEGGEANNLSAAPLPDLMGVGTNGGFRPKRSPTSPPKYAYVVLYTTFDDPAWPDHLDPQTGIFTYYGDNKSPGSTTEYGSEFDQSTDPSLRVRASILVVAGTSS